MANKRSDVAKLVTASRKIWRESEAYKEAKRRCRVRPGWYRCQECLKEREVIRIDHIEAIGKQPKELFDFGPWLQKLFCPSSNLQGLDVDCHKEKSKSENRQRRSMQGKSV